MKLLISLFSAILAATGTLVGAAQYASEVDFSACVEEAERDLHAQGACGSGCGASIVSLCQERVGILPPNEDAADELIELLKQDYLPNYRMTEVLMYPKDHRVRKELEAYEERLGREVEAMQKRNRLIENWKFMQEGDYIIIEGTTNRSGGLMSAAVECDGEYVGNALGSVKGGGTFTMMINNVSNVCRKVSLSRISIE